MQISFHYSHKFGVAVMTAAFLVFINKASSETIPATEPVVGHKLELPFRTSEGALIGLLTAESAKKRSDGKADLEKVTLEHYRNSEVDWTMLTPYCIFDNDKQNQGAVSESDVRIFNKDIDITGMGFHWLNATNRFIIRNTAKVVIHKGLSNNQLMELSGKTDARKTKGSTEINSDSLIFAYDDRVDKHAERTATFTGNVVAVDPQLTLKCAEMDVFFEEKSNTVARVVAKNDVQMYSEERTGKGDKAIFTRETGTILLSGNNPQLQDEKGQRIISRGDSILYNLRTKRMDVNKPTVEIQSHMDSGSLIPSSSSNLYASNTVPKKVEVDAASSSTKPFTKIDADVLNFESTNHIAIFNGNVVAVDPPNTLKCKTLKVFFTENNHDIVRAEAYDNVQMIQGSKEATGDRAVFTKETNIIVISGEKARLKDEKGNWILSRGDGIFYDVQTKQLKVDMPTIEILPSNNKDLIPKPQPVSK